MSRFSEAVVTGLDLFVAGVVLAAGLHGNVAGAEPQPEPAASKANTAPKEAASAPDAKVATVFGRDIFRKDLEPPAKWLEARQQHLKLHGETPGLVPLDTYRLDKLRQIIWTPLSEKYIPKKDVEPTEEELQEFVAHHRQLKARMQQERQEHLKQLQAEADKLEKQLPTQDSEDQGETTQRIQRMRKEISAIEKSFEINRKIEGKGKDFEQFFAKWCVGRWKGQRWFYKRYGGRVIFQQAGLEAIDAMRDFLKEAEAKKDFVIYDQELHTKFWAPFTREPPGSVASDPDKLFEHPWSSGEPSTDNKKRPIAPAAKGQPSGSSKPSFQVFGRGSNAAAFPMELSLEDDAKAEISIKLERKRTLQKAFPGTLKLDLTTVGDGQHNLYIQCPGYFTKIASVQTSGDRASLERVKLKLYRNRYVILRCAFNTRGGRNLEGDGVEEEHLALANWTGPRYFSEDWQIWQSSRGGGDTPCDVLYLDFHRISTGFGFAKPAKGVSYEEMKEAPEGGYRCKRNLAKKGLVLYCRVDGNQGGLGYGKLLVEDVTETPPKGVRVVELRQ
jgi:hypothetical protein